MDEVVLRRRVCHQGGERASEICILMLSCLVVGHNIDRRSGILRH